MYSLLYFRKWKSEGLIDELHDILRSYVRRKAGKQASPSLGIIDSRSVKTSHHTNSVKGIDDGKKVKGRKQHIITDTMGLLFCVKVHSANIRDGKAAIHVIEKLRYKFSLLVMLSPMAHIVENSSTK